MESKWGRRRLGFPNTLKICANSWRLSPPVKARQTWPKLLIVGNCCLSGTFKNRHGVVVYLNTYTNEQTTQDGEKTVQERKGGTAIGATPSHAIRIELKF